MEELEVTLKLLEVSHKFHNNIISSMHMFTIQLTKGWSTTKSRHYIIILPMKEVANEAEEEEEESKSDDPKLDFEVIDALLDALDLEE